MGKEEEVKFNDRLRVSTLETNEMKNYNNGALNQLNIYDVGFDFSTYT